MTAFIHIITEWLELISLAFCIGALVCRLWVFASLKTAGNRSLRGLAPSPGAESTDQGDLLAVLWLLFGIGIAAMISSSAVNLLLHATEMSGRPFSDVFPALPTVLFQTHIGRVWLIRIAALIALSIALKVRRNHDSRGFLVLMLVIAIIISMTKSASGHAADAGDFSLPEIMDWLHLLAVSTWGGGLFALSIVIPKLLRSADRSAPMIGAAASRFSRIAGIAVGIVAVTAIYNAWFHVGGAEALLKTPYGRTVTAKIFLFFLLINLGAFNRYISVPLLREWAGLSTGGGGIIQRIIHNLTSPFLDSRDGHKAALRFKWVMRVESLLVMGVLLCVGVLRHEIPARHQMHLEEHLHKHTDLRFEPAGLSPALRMGGLLGSPTQDANSVCGSMNRTPTKNDFSRPRLGGQAPIGKGRGEGNKKTLLKTSPAVTIFDSIPEYM